MTGAAIQSDKELAVHAVQRLPDSATLDEISDELALLAALRRSEKAADEGRVISQDQVKRRSAEFRDSIAQARKDVAEGKFTTHEDLKRQFGL